MPEQGNKYNIPHLKVSLEAIFSEMIQTMMNARWMLYIRLCWNHLLSAFAAGILWKTQPWDIFARIRTAKCIASCNHDGFLEDNYCVPFFKLRFLIPTLCHIFCSPKALKIYGESEFESSVSRNKLGKYKFLWFQKRDFYF